MPHDPILIKNRDLDALMNSLAMLDGRHEVVRITGSDGVERNIINVVPYKLAAKVRMLAARWLTVLKVQAEEARRAQEGLFKQFQIEQPNNRPPIIAPENTAAYQQEINTLREVSSAYGIGRLPLALMSVEENKLPITLLSALDPILDATDSSKG